MLRARAERVLLTIVTAVYVLGVVVLLLAPVTTVYYQTLFWEFAGRHVGFGWSARHERLLDDVVNVAMFAPMGFFVHRWWRRSATSSWTTVWGTLGLVTTLAATSETIQIFLPFRHVSMRDVMTDIIGGALGVGLDTAISCATRRERRDVIATKSDAHESR